jgi:hypothetical protein
MTRDEFRKAVFERDGNICVVPGCRLPAQDAHHIIERALWKDPSEEGGYFLDNGASVCGIHHIHAEKNFIPPQALRNWAGITRIILPKSFDPGNTYDKWGSAIKRPNRESIKYPHTPYLPFTLGVCQADIDEAGYAKVENLLDKPLVVTIKLDGSNSFWSSKKVCARNGHDAPHKSFDLAKSLHSRVQHLIPVNIQVFGEWLYALHSIHYKDDLALDSLFQIFGVYRTDQEMWLSWDETMEWAERLGYPTVPVVKYYTFLKPWVLEKELCELGWNLIKKGHEGFVARSIYPYHYGQFTQNLGKFVRPNHVTTTTHWAEGPIVKNEVR